jgi:O-acetylhomoserine (thiol)-lyase
MNSFQRLNKPPFTKTLHPATLALHGRELGTSPAVPIWQSVWNEELGALAPRFGHEALDAIYPSVSNPTQAILEDRLAAFEGGSAALAFSSGQAASAAVVLNVARSGDNFVTSTDLYGGTWVLFANTLRELGIEARFVDPSDPENFKRATDDRTRLYYAETLPNPTLNVFPIREVADIGRSCGVPLVMDNTASPLIVRPFEHGAAIVLYSTTKYIGGHGTTIGGALIEGGTFPWEQNAKRFPLLTQPDDEHPDLIWTEVAKPLGPIAFALRARFKLLANLGSGISPFAAFQILQGLETLPVRMEQHCANAFVVANYLAGHSKIEEVYFPGLQSGKHRSWADTYLRGGHGALVGFELRDGAEAGKRFIDALKLIYHVANIGDARTLAIHPATTTHSQLSKEDQLATGVTPGYVRLSIGIEHPDDIISDLAQALAST